MADKGLLIKDAVFFDAFCGMGSVSSAINGTYSKIIINDMLKCCTVYTRGRLVSNECDFKVLGFNPFDFLQKSEKQIRGFFYKNYSPAESQRMYFTPENAARIDFFRWQIEDWKLSNLITEEEYTYLLACLLDSVSKISNTAGVYGAFLKKWDKRALKTIEFSPINNANTRPKSQIEILNDKIENIIRDVECDILYLDPPYTQNQYGTQYHLLETLILNDSPSISKITGSRPVTPLKSDWSKNYRCHILLDKIIADTKAKHIFLSYNNDGLMSKDYIEATLKRYGSKNTFDCHVMQYKKYNNYKCKNNDGHYEYLFYIQKDDSAAVIESPLNYTGSKSKMINEIKKLLPKSIDTFVDVFGGGFNVGINVNAKKIIYNDINPFVVGLIKSFSEQDTFQYINYIEHKISKYDLAPNNKESYNHLRQIYNETESSKRDPKMLYTLILYGFQQQIRFNNSHEFNNPSGSRWFNDKLLSKFISFARVSRNRQNDIQFFNFDFTSLIKNGHGCFLYLDPPYRFTTGVYNDGKRGFQGWTKSHEEEMCQLLNRADQNGIKFMLSYILENEGIINKDMYFWAKKNNYKITPIDKQQGKYNKRKEVLIMNYTI